MAWRWGKRGKPVRSSSSSSSPPAATHESGELRAMTQGVTIRPHGLGFDETYGMDRGGSYLDAAAAGATADRSLHANGLVCPRCGRPFAEDEPARRLTTGELVHDVCFQVAWEELTR